MTHLTIYPLLEIRSFSLLVYHTLGSGRLPYNCHCHPPPWLEILFYTIINGPCKTDLFGIL
jgi:hypothetical protein